MAFQIEKKQTNSDKIRQLQDAELLAIVNEEGRIMGLPYNFTLNGVRIVGTAVICKTAGEEFAGLTAERG